VLKSNSQWTLSWCS